MFVYAGCAVAGRTELSSCAVGDCGCDLLQLMTRVAMGSRALTIMQKRNSLGTRLRVPPLKL